VLWWLADDRALGDQGRAVIQDAEDVVVSAASAWEIAIKRALGKLDAPDDFASACETAGFSLLQIGFEHARAAGGLPRLHADPFDRMLVAQAQLDGLSLMTRDRRLEGYGVHVVQA
jgi:PIN domain nuclease of toxin-antitoxin system